MIAMMMFSPACLLTVRPPFGILLLSGAVFWPYFAGAVVLVAGIVRLSLGKGPQFRREEWLLALGPLFYAIPMAVFGAQHFTETVFIAAMIPGWIPGHLFWTYLVGTALIAAALSMATGIQSRWAGLLLGLMLVLFVLLMHLPNFLKEPHNRFQLAVVLRELSFGGGAWALAATRTEPWHKIGRSWLIAAARYLVAIPLMFFGVENVLNPAFVPSIPLNRITPAWIPGHLFWSYLTGIVFVISGLLIAFRKYSRMAATGGGALVLLLILFVYVPMLAVSLTDIAKGLNYFADTLAFSGELLLLAKSLPKEAKATVADALQCVGL